MTYKYITHREKKAVMTELFLSYEKKIVAIYLESCNLLGTIDKCLIIK